jgi:large subunit ribosomal protein L20
VPAGRKNPGSAGIRSAPEGSALDSSTGDKPVARRFFFRVAATRLVSKTFSGNAGGRFFDNGLAKRSKPMARVKRGTKRRARRKKYLKRTKGFFLTKSKLYQSAQEAANRADRYAFRDRRVKKRQYRRLWIQRIGAAARANGITYGQLIHGLKAAGIALDRKVLADIAVKDAAGFTQLAEKAKAFAAKPAGGKA